MPTYIVSRRIDGAEVYRYTADAPTEWSGFEFATHVHLVQPDVVVLPAARPPQQWTAVEFLLRFTPAERMLARKLRETDPVLEDFFGLLELSEYIHSDDRNTRLGMGYLVMQGVLTPARRGAILGDPA